MSGQGPKSPVLVALEASGYLQAFKNLCAPEVNSVRVRRWIFRRLAVEFTGSQVEAARRSVGRSALPGGVRPPATGRKHVHVHYRRARHE